MKIRRIALGVAIASLVSWVAVAPATGLVEEVRRATERFKDVAAATAAGYAPFLGCVSGPQEGAMGLHYVNNALVGDGLLDLQRPEALMYEAKNGRLHLVGVEYIVIADAWNAKNQAPPTLMGQAFHHTGSPNRYGIPAFYALHVWAWKHNPHGMFVDWNPRVSCEGFTNGAVR
ncbi:MAG TPA: hypothetical protein VFV05_17595 [Methylomirabilota bacterium]|nr:hypothetical protein [Methylomirabilota bacterium]